MEESAEPPPGFFASLHRLGRVAVGIAHNRLELLLVEWEEERRRGVEALVLIMAAAVLALLTLTVATFLLVVIFWDDHRVAVLTILSLLYLAGTFGVGWKLRTHLRNWSAFPATLAELKKDKACLDDKS